MEYDYQKLIFFYDSTGRREGFRLYEGTTFAGDFYYLYNAQGDVTGIVDENMYLIVRYTYDSWGKLIACEGPAAEYIGTLNPFLYRGYIYDEETKLYYLNSRYYDPETGRFLNADDVAYLGADGTPLSYNLFAYCMNNPVNCFDFNGNWSMPNWLKATIGVVATVAAVAITVATGGAALPIIATVAVSTISSGISGYIAGGKQGMVDGLCEGLMWGGIGALGGASLRTAKVVKAAKEGIVIGKCGAFETVAKDLGCKYYEGLTGYKVIEKINPSLARELGWAQNKSFVKGVMMLGGEIFDLGGELTGSYARERILIEGYKNITWIGGVF